MHPTALPLSFTATAWSLLPSAFPVGKNKKIPNAPSEISP
jgi:hypothetical protein